METYDFFISHSTRDKYYVDSIVRAIEDCGYKCWVSPRDIPAGMSYAEAIIYGIKSSGTFLLIVSENSIVSQDVLGEVDNAHSLKKKIIPVRLSDVTLSDSLSYYVSTRQWITLDKNYIEEITTLLGLKCAADTAKPKIRTTPLPPKTDKDGPTGLLAKLKKIPVGYWIGGLLFWIGIIGEVCYHNHKADKVQAMRESGIEKLNEGYFQSAMKIFEDLSKKNDDVGNYYLGVMYGNGFNTELNREKAADYYKLAAANGYAPAQNNLGYYYETSSPQKADSAIINYRAAAEHGNAAAQNNLGRLYLVARNYPEAKRWFEKSIDNGSTAALVNLGCMYMNGWGVEQDVDKASDYFSDAAKKGNSAAKLYLGGLYMMTYTAEDNEDFNIDLPLKLFKQVSNDGQPLANYLIAKLYREGVGDKLQKDSKISEYWLEKGDTIWRDYIEQDYNMARVECTLKKDVICEEAAENMAALAWEYYNSSADRNKDETKAQRYFLKAAQYGNAEGMAMSGVFYQTGVGGPEDIDSAFYWFNKYLETNDTIVRKLVLEHLNVFKKNSPED